MTLPFAVPTRFTVEALRQVRDPHVFKWYAIVLLAFVVYVYAVEIERGRFDIVAAGLAVFLADWFNELINALVLHTTHTAALWTETGPTAYQFLIGLNVESMFMFAVAGIAFAKTLPADRTARILGLPNRFVLALGLSLVSVAVEEFLVSAGVFHWHYWWWNRLSWPVIVVFGYLWFYMYAAWVFDTKDVRSRWTRLGVLAAVDLVIGLICGVALGWL
jgi:hypothetical protein